jgi:hypothetical protein
LIANADPAALFCGAYFATEGLLSSQAQQQSNEAISSLATKHNFSQLTRFENATEELTSNE